MIKFFKITFVLLIINNACNAQNIVLKSRISTTKAYEMSINVNNGVAHITRTEIDYDSNLKGKNYNLAKLEFDNRGYFVLPNDNQNYYFVTFSDQYEPINLRQNAGGCNCFCWGSQSPDHTCYVNDATNDCAGGCTSCLGDSFWNHNGSVSVMKDGVGVSIKANSVVIE